MTGPNRNVIDTKKTIEFLQGIYQVYDTLGYSWYHDIPGIYLIYDIHLAMFVHWPRILWTASGQHPTLPHKTSRRTRAWLADLDDSLPAARAEGRDGPPGRARA